jgi:predicted nucleic acid-binding protein
MKVLLDTNIVIHREAATVIKEDIGVLFRWLDNLHHTKCIHPVTVEELSKYEDPKTLRSLGLKLSSYNILKTEAPIADRVRGVGDQLDENQNDRNDTLIINELFSGRVDALISEDKKILQKASLLGLADRVYTIDGFLEKVTAENPALADYKVLAVKKEHFGNLDLADNFFISLKEDYPGFEKWFNRKTDETVYVCRAEGQPVALLYLKIEGKDEDYTDINPAFPKKKRLKISTFKVALNGFRLGERFLKIVFDNAIRFKVEEIYVTTFDKRIEQQRLINLFEDYGFRFHGRKSGPGVDELVYVRPFGRVADRSSPKLTFPFFSMSGQIFLAPIYPEYHTELFPDSILRTESPDDFVENEPHRNAISKVYISRSIERNLKSGDVIVFYRTGGYHRGVVSTLGVVEGIIDKIPTRSDFIRLCRKRSVFTDEELARHWNYNPRRRPFIVNFLYIYSFPKRINMKRLIEIGVIPSVDEAPRGFSRISVKNLRDILKECQADESIVVD